jgi:hypothetical protein
VGHELDAVEFSVALDLSVDVDKEEVIWSKAGSGATFVDMFGMGMTAVFVLGQNPHVG